MVYGAKLRTIGTEGHTLKSEKITIIPLCSAASLSIMEEASESHDIRRFMQVVLGGFEPPQTEPKTVVLPLHHRTIVSAKVVIFYSTAKFFTCFFTFTFLSICKRATSQEFSQ